MTTYKDTDLHEALRRKYANTPQLPSDFMNRMQQASQKNRQRSSFFIRHSPLVTRRFAAVFSIAAVLLIAFLLWPERHETPITQQEVQPVVAEASQQPISQPIIEEKKDNINLEALPPTGGAGRGARKKDETVMAEVQAKAQPVKKRARIDNEQDIQSISSCNHQEVADIAPPSSNNDKLSSEKQEVLTLPADKQALADIFLAEEALQVAYEQRAQQEALRTYAASITGEEAPGPIIAF